MVEAPVLDRLQRVDQERRYLVRLEDQTVFAVHWEQAADLQRVEPQERQLVAGRVDDARDSAAFELDRDAPGRLFLGAVAVRARDDVERTGARAIAAGPVRDRGLSVTEPAQLGHEVVPAEAAAGVELERGCEDLCRNGPAARLELAADLDAEERRVRRKPDRRRKGDEQGEADDAAEEAAAACATRRALAPRARLALRGLLLRSRSFASRRHLARARNEVVSSAQRPVAATSIPIIASERPLWRKGISGASAQQVAEPVLDPVLQTILQGVAQTSLDDLAEVRADLRIGHRAAQRQRQRLAGELTHLLAAGDASRARERRLERVVETLLGEREVACAGQVHERRARDEIAARRDAVLHRRRAADQQILGAIGLLGGGWQSPRRVVDDAERASEVEALDRAVAHRERDAAIRARDVLEDRSARARKVEIEIAGAAETRVAGQRGDQRRGRERARAARERQAGLRGRIDREAPGELAAVEARTGGVEDRASVADDDPSRDGAHLETGEHEVADLDAAVDLEIRERVCRELDVAGGLRVVWRVVRQIARGRRQVAVDVHAIDRERESMRGIRDAVDRVLAGHPRVVEHELDVAEAGAIRAGLEAGA